MYVDDTEFERSDFYILYVISACKAQLVFCYRSSWEKARKKAMFTAELKKKSSTNVCYRFLTSCSGERRYQIFTACSKLLRR